MREDISSLDSFFLKVDGEPKNNVLISSEVTNMTVLYHTHLHDF